MGLVFVSCGLPRGSAFLNGIPEGLLLKAVGLLLPDTCLLESEATGLHQFFNDFDTLFSNLCGATMLLGLEL